MGLLDKLIVGGGVALLGAALKNARKEAQETRRRRLSPLWFDPRLSQRDFNDLVQDIASRTPRLEQASVDGMTVTLRVSSISGLSHWSAEIDFNDYGRLTGTYWLSSENDRSLIPAHFADKVQEQILNRMRADSAEEPAGRSHHNDRRANPDPASMLPPAGWHPDPYGSARLRYWDGRTWTEHVAH